jgi:hypothetical protein
MSIKQNKFGETLIEVVISLSAIMLAGAAAASIVLTALQTTILSENYLVAQNLALEAIEIVKNTRDTNYMRYPLPSQIDDNWLVYDDDEHSFEAGKNCYSVDIDPNTIVGRPICNYRDDGKFSPHGETGHSLYLYKSLSGNPEDPKIYTHAPSSVPEEKSKFYRGIEVISADAENIIMNVVVEWSEGAAVRRFAAEDVVITNFQ